MLCPFWGQRLLAQRPAFCSATKCARDTVGRPAALWHAELHRPADLALAGINVLPQSNVTADTYTVLGVHVLHGSS